MIKCRKVNLDFNQLTVRIISVDGNNNCEFNSTQSKPLFNMVLIWLILTKRCAKVSSVLYFKKKKKLTIVYSK